MKLGEKLTKLRKLKGMSQEDVASQITVSRQAISRWENGDVLPDAENILQISKLFGVSTDYLLNDDCESDKDVPIVREAVNDIKLEQKRQSTLVVCLGWLGIFTLLLIAGVYLKYSAVWISGIIGQIISVMAFEAVAPKYSGMLDAKQWKRRRYRIAIWMLAIFPAFAVAQALLTLYPRPYSSKWFYIIFAFIYLLVSCVISHLLWNRKSE